MDKFIYFAIKGPLIYLCFIHLVHAVPGTGLGLDDVEDQSIVKNCPPIALINESNFRDFNSSIGNIIIYQQYTGQGIQVAGNQSISDILGTSPWGIGFLGKKSMKALRAKPQSKSKLKKKKKLSILKKILEDLEKAILSGKLKSKDKLIAEILKLDPKQKRKLKGFLKEQEKKRLKILAKMYPYQNKLEDDGYEYKYYFGDLKERKAKGLSPVYYKHKKKNSCFEEYQTKKNRKKYKVKVRDIKCPGDKSWTDIF